jgi:predicted transcriptional regulator
MMGIRSRFAEVDMSRMFAVVSSDDQSPVFVKQGYVGFWSCKEDHQVAWAHMHLAQGEAVTKAALRGSMLGWDNPGARLAVEWKEPRSFVAAKPESNLPKEILKRALSIRQPLSELILRGKKKNEYRSRLTHIRGRVYLYAGKKVATVRGFPDEEAQALPRGVIVGSVEIVGCHWDKKEECFAWELANPRRYREPLKAKGGVPQPGFWHPTF